MYNFLLCCNVFARLFILVDLKRLSDVTRRLSNKIVFIYCTKYAGSRTTLHLFVLHICYYEYTTKGNNSFQESFRHSLPFILWTS